MAPAASPSPRKSFACTEPGCRKSFLRSEHLSRHKLNHQPSKIFSCPQCPKEFVRLDLYQRHQKRHENGMWYRKVGGVVERGQRKNATRQHKQLRFEQAQDESDHMEPLAIPTGGEASASYELPLPDQETDGEETLNGLEEPPSTIPLEHHVRPSLSFSDGLHQSPTVDVTNTLFNDVSVNAEDLPDGLEWFFESPHNDFSTADAINGMAFAPLVHADRMVYEPPIYPPDPGFPPQSSSDFEWSIARTRLQMALNSLPREILESTFFNTVNLAMCFDTYFERYHDHFPFLHRPTLSITESNPLLLASIITLGSTLVADDTIFQIGQRIHDDLRWIIFANGQFQPPAPLWCLQALLLVQAQGKMFSTAKQHEMAHIFHGAILTMMQRGRATFTAPVPTSSPTSASKCSWRQWAGDESSRRTSFFAFLMDAQHSSVFGHSPVLSVSDVRLPLPCTESLWECQTAEAWEEILAHTPKSPQFLPTLKALLGNSLVPSICSNFSRLILLHGLMSLTSHLMARDATTLGIERGKVGSRDTGATISQVEDWKEVMSKAIGRWSFCLYSLQPSLCLEAAQPLHRMAYIALYANITDIHIIAKDRTLVSENPILRKQYLKAEARLKEWGKTDEARKAVLQSLLLVKEVMFSRRNYKAKHDNISPRPWCLYHAILVLWAFGLMTGGESADDQGDYLTIIGAEEYVVQVMSCLQSGSATIPGVNRTKGLLHSVQDALEGSRWELLQDAYMTLGRLIDASPLGQHELDM